MKTLGMIGGMGPAATIDLYSKILKFTPAKTDQEHIHVIIDSYPQIPDRTAFILGKGKDPVPALVESAKRLEAAGADALCMPCNTAHYFLPQITEHINIPFLSIVDATIDELKKIQAKKIAVLATIGTKTAKVYENKLIENGYTVVPLSEKIEKQLMTCIYDGVKSGRTLEYIDCFKETLHEATQLGPEVFFAACTEIPLLTQHVEPPIPTIDATLALAQKCVHFCLE